MGSSIISLAIALSVLWRMVTKGRAMLRGGLKASHAVGGLASNGKAFSHKTVACLSFLCDWNYDFWSTNQGQASASTKRLLQRKTASLFVLRWFFVATTVVCALSASRRSPMPACPRGGWVGKWPTPISLLDSVSLRVLFARPQRLCGTILSYTDYGRHGCACAGFHVPQLFAGQEECLPARNGPLGVLGMNGRLEPSAAVESDCGRPLLSSLKFSHSARYVSGIAASA